MSEKIYNLAGQLLLISGAIVYVAMLWGSYEIGGWLGLFMAGLATAALALSLALLAGVAEFHKSKEPSPLPQKEDRNV